MKIIVTGAGGFVGRPLVDALRRERHTVVIFSRKQGPGVRAWDPEGSGPVDLESADAVINLAGENIAAKPWTDRQKRRIFDSRILSTRRLVKSMEVAPKGGMEADSSVALFNQSGIEFKASSLSGAVCRGDRNESGEDKSSC